MNDDQVEFAAAAKQLIEEDQPVVAVALEPLGQKLIAEFNQAVINRQLTEQRWLQDLRQYRGKYDPDVEARIRANKSKAFVRKTRVKVKTVDSRVADLLFPAGKDKNWNIDPTPKPSLSPDQMVEIRAELQAVVQAQAQQTQMAQQPAPGAPGDPAAAPGGPAAPAGPAPAPKVTRSMFDQAVVEWAKKRCARMSLTIDDQLKETKYKQICARAIHSGNLYGTGIVKGPLVERKVRMRFVNQGGKWVPQSESYVVPFLDYVPLWRFYPDMSVTELENCRYTYERHLMGKAEMSALADRKSFDREKIVAYVLQNPNGLVQQRFVDDQLRIIGDRTQGLGDTAGKYEVLERWGYIDGVDLRNAGVEVPDDRLHESFFSNVWLLPSGEVIKSALQPINGVTWPYHIYYFDKDESSIFGEGLATIMRDDQTNVNASTRLMLDNAAITSGPQMEVNPHLLSNVDKLDEFNPWKVWLRNNTSPGQPAVRAIELPSRIAELGQMVSMFENNADETTAIPRYMSGENVTSGSAATASGLSMQMGNVNIVIKDLISNWDEGVTSSFIRGMYYWNMQFNPDDEIKGDFDVSASGTASLVAKEVRSQLLMGFAQSASSQQESPYVKWDELVRQRAEALELVDVVKTDEEIKAEQSSPMAQQMQQMQLQMQQAQLGEAQAKVQKMLADGELAKKRVDEVVAKIAHIAAQTIQTKVEAAYAALQAGGTATQSPYIAPAGDEILREAGWSSSTQSSEIANLNGPPVQPDAATSVILPKGASFAVEPRAGQPGQQAPGGDGPTGNDAQVNEPNPQVASTAPVARPPAQTGMVGRERGIETQRIEPPR